MPKEQPGFTLSDAAIATVTISNFIYGLLATIFVEFMLQQRNLVIVLMRMKIQKTLRLTGNINNNSATIEFHSSEGATGEATIKVIKQVVLESDETRQRPQVSFFMDYSKRSYFAEAD